MPNSCSNRWRAGSESCCRTSKEPKMRNSQTGPSLLYAVAVASALSLIAISATAQPGPNSASAPQLIVMREMRFNPPDKSISPGTVVEWKNEDIFSHSVTADDGSFDSGLIAPGQSWRKTFTNAQTFRYHCRPHPNMAARLVVSATTTSATPTGAQSANQGAGSGSLRWVPPNSPQQIHPILVNFTAALLPLALLSDLLGRVFRRQSLHNAAWWMVLYAAAITPLTVAAGWWWKHDVGPELPPKLITIHQWLGTSAALLFIILAVWRWRIQRRGVPPSIPYLVCALLAVLALIYQGSLGGAMVFGK
jgi:uncharacterized membrane protein/plastocyanin